MDQIFNELSISSCYENKHESRAGMERALIIWKKLAFLGLTKTIITTRDFSTRYLCDQYSVHNWATDKDVDADTRRILLSSITRSPFLEDVFALYCSQLDNCDFYYDNNKAYGLAVSYFLKTPSISLDGDTRFRTDPTNITLIRLESNGDVTEEKVDVCTLCHIDQVEPRADWIRTRLCESISNGNELISRQKIILSHLRFANKATAQLAALNASSPLFSEIVAQLFLLQKTMQDWSSGPFQPGGLTWSVESDQTLKRYKESRSFLCSDGIKRTFSYHTKFSNQRIYYYPIPNERIVHIGYIGDHLPTVNFPT